MPNNHYYRPFPAPNNSLFSYLSSVKCYAVLMWKFATLLRLLLLLLQNCAPASETATLCWRRDEGGRARKIPTKWLRDQLLNHFHLGNLWNSHHFTLFTNGHLTKLTAICNTKRRRKVHLSQLNKIFLRRTQSPTPFSALGIFICKLCGNSS